MTRLGAAPEQSGAIVHVHAYAPTCTLTSWAWADNPPSPGLNNGPSLTLPIPQDRYRLAPSGSPSGVAGRYYRADIGPGRGVITVTTSLLPGVGRFTERDATLCGDETTGKKHGKIELTGAKLAVQSLTTAMIFDEIIDKLRRSPTVGATRKQLGQLTTLFSDNIDMMRRSPAASQGDGSVATRAADWWAARPDRGPLGTSRGPLGSTEGGLWADLRGPRGPACPAEAQLLLNHPRNFPALGRLGEEIIARRRKLRAESGMLNYPLPISTSRANQEQTFRKGFNEIRCGSRENFVSRNWAPLGPPGGNHVATGLRKHSGLSKKKDSLYQAFLRAPLSPLGAQYVATGLRKHSGNFRLQLTSASLHQAP
ncbi:hypothetical protein Bbelb_376070 [Branchiostoma belcheri]|nr:hypothetical protein Bbelb_376070 [Branchiostoma belcheri]